MLPSPSDVDKDVHDHERMKEPSSPPRRETPDVSHAMEDVNVTHRDEESSRHDKEAETPSFAGPTLYDRVTGAAAEAWAALVTGDKQEEEAGRTLREYGREGIEAAEKSGSAGAMG
ncbi:hypothetical protein JCM6882_004556 [Rhodosporidiobolus microsporus]